MKSLLAASALLLSLVADAHAGELIEGMVRTVYNGGTVLLATREDSLVKVRLYGIDAPDAKPGSPGQPFGEIARRTLMYKIMGRQVSAEFMDIDRDRRTVVVIRYACRDINREMVAEGMAWAYRQYLQEPYASEYTGAEEVARARHKGLWRDASPLPPWEYRKAREIGGKRRERR